MSVLQHSKGEARQGQSRCVGGLEWPVVNRYLNPLEWDMTVGRGAGGLRYGCDARLCGESFGFMQGSASKGPVWEAHRHTGRRDLGRPTSDLLGAAVNSGDSANICF